MRLPLMRLPAAVFECSELGSCSEDEAVLDEAQLEALQGRVTEAAGRWQVALQVLLREGCYGTPPSFVIAPESPCWRPGPAICSTIASHASEKLRAPPAAGPCAPPSAGLCCPPAAGPPAAERERQW